MNAGRVKLAGTFARRVQTRKVSLSDHLVYRLVKMIGVPEEVETNKARLLPHSPPTADANSPEKRRLEKARMLIKNKLQFNSQPASEIHFCSQLVIVEGNIGVGKTTLARKVSQELGYALFLEPTVENPYLEKFYAEPKKYALKLQLWILEQRYLTYVEAVKHLTRTGTC